MLRCGEREPMRAHGGRIEWLELYPCSILLGYCRCLQCMLFEFLGDSLLLHLHRIGSRRISSREPSRSGHMDELNTCESGPRLAPDLPVTVCHPFPWYSFDLIELRANRSLSEADIVQLFDLGRQVGSIRGKVLESGASPFQAQTHCGERGPNGYF
jgi:hypothetical protein